MILRLYREKREKTGRDYLRKSLEFLRKVVARPFSGPPKSLKAFQSQSSTLNPARYVFPGMG